MLSSLMSKRQKLQEELRTIEKQVGICIIAYCYIALSYYYTRNTKKLENFPSNLKVIGVSIVLR